MAIRLPMLAGLLMALAFGVALGIAVFGRGGGAAAPYAGPVDTIAFATDATGGATGVYLLRAADLSNMHLVQAVDNPAKLVATQRDGIYSVAWAPDGATIYYLARRLDGQQPHADLWAVRADGTDGHLVRRDFVSAHDAERYPLFALASFEGGEQGVAYLSPDAGDVAAPSRSPDGRRAAVRVQGIDSAFICVGDAGAAMPPASLTGCFSDSPRTSFPAWSPR